MKLRYLACAALPALCATAARAEDTTTSGIDSVITDVQTGIQSLVDKIVPAIGVIIVASLVFWGIRALVKWGRHFFGK